MIRTTKRIYFISTKIFIYYLNTFDSNYKRVERGGKLNEVFFSFLLLLLLSGCSSDSLTIVDKAKMYTGSVYGQNSPANRVAEFLIGKSSLQNRYYYYYYKYKIYL